MLVVTTTLLLRWAPETRSDVASERRDIGINYLIQVIWGITSPYLHSQRGEIEILTCFMSLLPVILYPKIILREPPSPDFRDLGICEKNMKEYVGNMKEYVGNMKEI